MSRAHNPEIDQELARYAHLWIPKKTLKEYGNTNYKIVPNWTPGPTREAVSSQSEVEDLSRSAIATEGFATSEDQDTVSEDPLPIVCEDPLPVVHEDPLPSVSEEHTTITESGVEGDVRVLSDEEGRSENLTRSQKRTRQKGRKRTVVARKPPTVKKRKRDVASEETKEFQLWIPRNTDRTKEDLNELDICLSAYDSVLKETMDSTDDPEMKELLAQHWRHTQKQMHSTIREVHSVLRLQEQCEEESAKVSESQRKYESALAAINQSKRDYASVTKKRRLKEVKMNAKKEMIESELARVRPVLSKLLT